MSKCMICGKDIIGYEDSELHGCDGDRIHIACKPYVDAHYDRINNMTNEEFSNWMKGGEM